MSTLGIFGTIAGAARLLDLNIDQTAIALALGASFASGLKANFGTMTKPLHVGHASRNGLFAAYMARGGFTANPAAFEDKQGFLDVFNGPGTYDAGKMLAGWYDPPECEGGGDPTLKPYPCCGSTHAPVNRAIYLAKTHDIQPDDIERVDAMPHARRLPHTNNPDPRTPLAAKFSVQYCVARALLNRAVTLDHFVDGAEFDPGVRALMPRIHAFGHPDIPPDGANQWGAEVVVFTKDGRRFASRVDEYERCGPGAGGQMMNHAELWTKFSDCAGRVLPAIAAAKLFDALLNLSGLETVTKVTELLRYDPDASKAA